MFKIAAQEVTPHTVEALTLLSKLQQSRETIFDSWLKNGFNDTVLEWVI